MKRGLTFLTGMLMGAALFGGGTAYAAGLMAEPSSQTFFVDGKQVYLQAYAIGGNNYVKLRDVGQAVNFNVTYDGATNSVQIATNEPYSEDMPAPEVTAPATPAAPASYTISADHWSREDFSRQANSAVFTGVYDRNLYNAIRQTLVDGNSAAPAYTMVFRRTSPTTTSTWTILRYLRKCPRTTSPRSNLYAPLWNRQTAWPQTGKR